MGRSDRVIVTKLVFDIGIIQVHAPKFEHKNDEVTTCCEDLDKAIKQVKSQDIKIVMRDFNAKVDTRIKDIMAPWGLGYEN